MSIESQKEAIRAHIKNLIKSIGIAREVVSGRTLLQVGRDEGVTKERIRQRVFRALRVCRREEYRPEGDTEFLIHSRLQSVRGYKDQWLDQLDRVKAALIKELEEAS